MINCEAQRNNSWICYGHTQTKKWELTCGFCRKKTESRHTSGNQHNKLKFPTRHSTFRISFTLIVHSLNLLCCIELILVESTHCVTLWHSSAAFATGRMCTQFSPHQSSKVCGFVEWQTSKQRVNMFLVVEILSWSFLSSNFLPPSSSSFRV